MAASRARTLIALLAAAAVWAAPPRKPPVLPPLLPGEALVLAGPDREVYRYGDAAPEGPMGGLAHLLWLRLEGDAWASGDVQFKCAGVAGPYRCSSAKGHGRVDLVKALQAGCNLAFMGWARMSAQRWQDDYGEGAAQARLLDVFRPFMSRRAADAEAMPELDMSWFGEGDLLRTSPDALLKWLIDPAQEESVRLFRRLFLSFYDSTFKENAWWLDPVTAPVAGQPGVSQAWAVGGNELIIAVLRLPPGSTRAEAAARFQTILVGGKKK